MDSPVVCLLVITFILVDLHYALRILPPEKPGECPNAKHLPSKCFLVHVCNFDFECEGDLKCCDNGCSNECVPPAKPGTCPDQMCGFGICVEQCSNDRDCLGKMKCCSNGCGHVCSEPAKPGRCPRPIPHFTTCKDECCSDNDCRGNKKCCYSGCGNQCTNVCRTKNSGQ